LTFRQYNTVSSNSSIMSSSVIQAVLLTAACAVAYRPSESWHGPHPPTISSRHGLPTAYAGGGPTATIDAGIIHGTTTSLPAATASINKFLGVPFAKSPPTRFAQPESAEKFTGPINVTAWSPACIQQFTYPLETQEFTEAVFNNPPPEESEDCKASSRWDITDMAETACRSLLERLCAFDAGACRWASSSVLGKP
jgi:hypothetical protein